MNQRRLPAIGAAVLAVALGGCGTADDRDQARATVERFTRALRDHDGGAACAELTAAAMKQLESQSGQACRGVITRLQLGHGPVTHAEVFVTNARVVIGGEESEYLDREPEGWRLSAIGCRSDEGKPRDRPQSCEVEA